LLDESADLVVEKNTRTRIIVEEEDEESRQEAIQIAREPAVLTVGVPHSTSRAEYLIAGRQSLDQH
jgi:hypothetical protein